MKKESKKSNKNPKNKEKNLLKQLPKISGKKINNNFTLTIGSEFYTKEISDPIELSKLKDLIKLYNSKPNTLRLEKIKKILKSKEKEDIENTKMKIKGEKKVIKKKIVEAKKEKAVARVARKVIIEGSKGKLVEKGESVFLAGYETVAMPQELVDKFKEFLKLSTEIQPLINFWTLCLLNPNSIARGKMFKYLNQQRFLITPSGYFVAYRIVKTIEGEKDVYTDAHTGKMRIKIGEVVSIPRSECDEDGSKDCSKGLHVGTPAFIGIQKGEGYVDQAQVGTGYNSGQKTNYEFGNQPIICLINPAHVVSVPESETRKMRCCEYYPFKLTTPREVISMESAELPIFENEYKAYEMEEIKRILDSTVLVDIEEKDVLGTKLKDLEESLFKEHMRYKTDNFNQELSLEEIQTIIQSRIKVIEKKQNIADIVETVKQSKTKN